LIELRDFRPANVHEQRFQVAFRYPVAFTRDALDPADHTLAWTIAQREPERRHPVVFVIDDGLLRAQPELAARCSAYVAAHAELLEERRLALVVPGGEVCKNDPALVAELQRELAAAHLDRQASVVILGGGAVLDAAGYAASTVHRGVRVVRLPSTVLSQCDGRVGVKSRVCAFAS